MTDFTRPVDFTSLSIADLLEARHAFHVHLANLSQVVGTAVGRYLIRYDDDNSRDPARPTDPKKLTPRTLDNSGVTPWSWPCVLVFVSEWATPAELAKAPHNFVPPRLYLPDGRIIPTCVVYAPRDGRRARPLTRLNFPSGLYGGGYPLLTDDQGQERIGSAGCLVTDGYYTYILTSSHLVGERGTVAYTVERGKRKPVARAHAVAAKKVPFEQLYPGMSNGRCAVNVDAGLFRVDNLNEWTAQVYGIGRIGEMVDLSVDNLSLDLIGRKVKAFGGASGALQGEVGGLFYRYRSVGGFDYVADLLIGPRKGDGTVATMPGDSGTLWFYDREAEDPSPAANGAAAANDARPIAVQWGAQSFLAPGSPDATQFALATNLSSVCRLLDVEIVRDWNDHHSLYWGKVGHYKIAISACLLLSQPHLKELLENNADRIAVSDSRIEDGSMPKAGDAYVPLADVADLVWRATRKKDAASHFADMDEPGPGRKTLLQLWMSSPASRTPAKWTAFYDALEKRDGKKRQDKHRGSLPFRVREFYEAMVQFVQAGDAASYVCAAGLLAHYVGDACQPLHVSYLHHGQPDNPEDDDVHEVYETRMLDRCRVELVQGVNEVLLGALVKTHLEGGAAAAHRVVKLMAHTHKILPPQRVLEVYGETGGRTLDMWEHLRAGTIENMAAGALCLAELWESAWVEGGGERTVAELSAVSQKRLKELYMDRTFLEVRWLREMSFKAPAADARRAAAATAAGRR
jgi:hypothetical protein